MSKLRRTRPAIVGSVLLLTACVHTGGGDGLLQAAPAANGVQPPARGEVVFSWKSDASGNEGTIEAHFPDGREFAGTFVQVTSTTWRDSYGPYWNAWSYPGWGMGGPWFMGPQMAFVTHYSGRLLAHLEDAHGTRMRCTFTLYDPPAGITGGGEGDCQLSTNERVFGAQLEDDDASH